MSLGVSKRCYRGFEIYMPPSFKIKKKPATARTHSKSKSKLFHNNSSNNHCSQGRVTKRNAFDSLISELAFSYDSLATINVMFSSLRHAYVSCDGMDSGNKESRLGDRERELLVAYDDLGLQVSHLEKKIALLEARLIQLKKGFIK